MYAVFRIWQFSFYWLFSSCSFYRRFSSNFNDAGMLGTKILWIILKIQRWAILASLANLSFKNYHVLKFSNRPKEFGKVLGLLFLMIIFSTFSRIQLKPPLFILSLSVFFNSIRPLFTSRFAKKSYNHHHYQRIRFNINVICNSIF